MPKGNETKYRFPMTKYCFPIVLAEGKVKVGDRRLMASEKVTTSVVVAAGLFRAQGWVYLEAYGNNLEDFQKLIGEQG